MRLLTLFLLLTSLSSVASPAPDFTLPLDGQAVQLSELKGHVVYVDFWASWCKPCRKSFPWMNQISQQYADQGLVVVAVNLDADAELAARFLQKVPADFPITYDPQGELAEQYQIIGMPSSYFIDKKGEIRFTHKGFFSAQQAHYEQQLITLLNETE
ncbi:MAG: thiol-disulfide isomerase/thioredoxin [Paraglaciecola sp.]|jgi:thiol-disulfide isomerase/thioredoxin